MAHQNIRIPFAGAMDLDDPLEAMPRGFHNDARNIIWRGNSGDMRAENTPGTKLISNTLPVGTNLCAGGIFDQVNDVVFFLNSNTNGSDGAYMLDMKSRAITPMLVSGVNSAAGLFNLNPIYPAHSMNIMYASEDIGNFWFWTDAYNRPQKLNITDALNNYYNNLWSSDYLTVARIAPIFAPECSYADDATKNINNLRKSLYQFRVRWVNRDLTKTICGPYSKLFAPTDPDSVATDIDPGKNNRIDVIINTGSADVKQIEIIARHTIGDEIAGTVMSDDFRVVVLDKAELGLADNVFYTFPFYNDQAYPYIDKQQSTALQHYIPKRANTQELLNGNILDYCGILEGYNFTDALNVTASVTTVDNDTVAIPFLFSTSNQQTFNPSPPAWSGFYYIYFSGDPQPGDVYTIRLVVNNTTALPVTKAITYNYTVNPGDTLTIVVNAFFAQFNADPNLGPNYRITTTAITGTPTGIKFNSADGIGHVLTSTTTIVSSAPPPPTTDDVNIACYHPRSRYDHALVYFDKYGNIIKVCHADAMLIETPEINTVGKTEPKITAITFSVYHQPPIDAFSFSWLRTDSLTFGTALPTVTCSTKKDGDFGYMEITNQQANQQNYPVWDFVDGDRVRIIGKFELPEVVFAYDFPVQNLVTDPVIGGVATTGIFLTVPFDAVLNDFGVTDKWYIEIYRPALNTDPKLQLYYECGQTYNVINPGTSTRAHQGMTQDQIPGTQPAIYTFTRADFYVRQRILPVAADLSVNGAEWIIDASVSDKYPSRISGTGRAFIIDPYTKEIYFPTMNRFSLPYQQDTNINDTNVFYAINFDEYDRRYGDIMRIKTHDRQLRIFQKRKCGMVPIFAQMVQNRDNTNTLVVSQSIINPIDYYAGDFGIGNQASSLASSSFVDYFPDPVKGYLLRLSLDGITPISDLYKAQSWSGTVLPPYTLYFPYQYGGYAKLLGVFQFNEDRSGDYICVAQAGNDPVGQYGIYNIGGESLVFNEKDNAFRTKYDFAPDFVLCAENKLISWFGGACYIHDNVEAYNTFYGSRYDSVVQIPSREPRDAKKEFMSMSYNAPRPQYGIDVPRWLAPTMGDISTSIGQQSNLVDRDFDYATGMHNAAFQRANNAQYGVIEGDNLKGLWLQMRLSNRSTSFTWISSLYINVLQSPKNF